VPTKREVWLIGPDPGNPGGIETVIATLLLKTNKSIKFSNLVSWAPHSLFGIKFFSKTAWTLICNRDKSSPTLHIHLGDGGSWWREGFLVRISMLLGYKTVLTLHGSSLETCSNYFLRFVGRILRFEKLDAIIVLSPRIELRLTVIYSNIHLMPNPITDYSKSYQWNPSNDNHVSFIGMLSTRKGIDNLIEVWGNLKEDFPGWELRIIGPKGDFKMPMESQLIQMGIKYLGPKSHQEVLQAISESAILVLPSRQEQSPMVIWEAMNIGTPIVASKLDGILFQLGENYPFLFEPDNTLDLRLKLSRLMSSKNLQLNASKYVAERSIKSIYENLESEYFSFY